MDPLLSSIIATKNSSLRLGILHSLHKAVYRGSVQGGALGSVSQRRSGYVLYLQVLGSRAKLLELGSTSLYPVTALAITTILPPKVTRPRVTRPQIGPTSYCSH